LYLVGRYLIAITKGLGRKLAVDGLARPIVGKGNTAPLISNHNYT